MESTNELHQGFLDDIVEISPLIEDYMAAKLYELEVEYSDGIDTSVLFNLVFGMVIGELTTMGIEVLGGTEMYNDPVKINLVKVLRKEFDIRNLKRTLVNSSDLRDNIYVASQDWDVENIVNVSSMIATETFPTSTTWEYIQSHSLDNVVSTHNLERHILRLIDNIEQGVFSDNREDEIISEYTSTVAEQRMRFIRNVSRLRDELLEIDGVVSHKANMVLDEALLTYDVDLINDMSPERVRVYLNNKDPHPAYRADGQEDIELVAHHKRLHSHHVEGLKAKKILKGELAADAPYAMLLVADGYRESWSFDKNKSTLNEYTKDLILTQSTRTMAEQWMLNLTKQ